MWLISNGCVGVLVSRMCFVSIKNIIIFLSDQCGSSIIQSECGNYGLHQIIILAIKWLYGLLIFKKKIRRNIVASRMSKERGSLAINR